MPAVGPRVLLLRPETRILQLHEDAILDPHLSTERQSLERPRLAEQLWVGRIREQRDTRIDDLVANLRAATLLREGRPSFVCAAGVQRECQQLYQVTDGLGLENDPVP